MEKNLFRELMINSPAFDQESFIPSKYPCEGENVNPPLEISGIPEEAKTLVLMVEDPDAPRGVFDHWIVWDCRFVRLGVMYHFVQKNTTFRNIISTFLYK